MSDELLKDILLELGFDIDKPITAIVYIGSLSNEENENVS